MLESDKWKKFPKAVDLVVRFSETTEVIFEAVVSAMETANGTLHLLRENGNVIKIRTPYLFYEFGEIDDKPDAK